MNKQKLEKEVFETELKGEKITFEINNMAKQANGAVLGTYGDTVVLATATMDNKAGDRPFFPLTVDYEERNYAIGKILGSRFMRREGRPSTEATLTARLIDRTIRPLFDSRIRNPIQVVITIISYDEEHDPDIIGLLSASLALGISDIPWNGPAAAFKPVENSFFAGIEGKINMIEYGACEASEEDVVSQFETAQNEINRLVKFQEDIIKKIGKEKQQIEFKTPSDEVVKGVEKIIEENIDKLFNDNDIDSIFDKLNDWLEENELEEEKSEANYLLESKVDNYVVKKAIDEEKRIDGRKMDEIRPLYAGVHLFNRLHGSALFMRGDTHLLALTTIGSPDSEQLIETIEFSGTKRFMLHYNFPDFSVGQAGRAHSPGRREIGHGSLAKKALEPFIPTKEEFPYAIRVVAETMSSNGSSSMATVCSSCLSLMDAGVPIKDHIAGIAMGVMYDEKTSKYKILTDIQGPEDHYGGMDLKVAGSVNGINAIQMDVKIDGLTLEMFKEALPQAKKARMEIIEVMKEELAGSRKELSPYAPKILSYKVEENQIGTVIGSGGKTINHITETAGNNTEINIDDDGSIFISSDNEESAQKALEMIKQITKEYKVGEIVEGPIVKILDFGAILDLGGGQDGLIHVSELADGFVKNVTDVVKEGEVLKAKVKKVENGKIGLSLKGMKNDKDKGEAK